MSIRTKNDVTRTPAAEPNLARDHFARRLQFETDCWDVHSTQDFDDRGFVLLDVRSPELYERGHLPGAVNISHWHLDEKRLAEYDPLPHVLADRRINGSPEHEQRTNQCGDMQAVRVGICQDTNLVVTQPREIITGRINTQGH